MKDLAYSLAPIIGLQLLALVAALFVYVQAPGRGVVKLLVVPLSLCAVLMVPYLFTQLMGYAVSWPLPDKFTFIAFNPVVKKGHKTDLEIWLKEDGATRLLRAPYSKALEKMLQDAAKGKKGGREARIQRKGDGTNDSNAPQEWELRFESPSDVPKDAGRPSMPEPPVQDEPLTKRYSI